MELAEDLKKQVLTAARDQGVSSVLFRNAIGRKLGLSVTDNECMSFLAIKGGVANPTELSRYTGLTTGSTTAMLDRLEEAGYIKRKPNPNDRRGILVEVNKKWAKTAAPLVKDIQQAHAVLIDSYSQKELEIVLGFLLGFTNNVVEQTKKIEAATS